MKKLIWNVVGLMTLCVFFVSCDKDDDEEMRKANVMVIHASPDAPAVDVRINNSLALTNVPFPANSPYNQVNAGLTNIKIAPAGTTTYVIDATVNLEENMNYSVFAIDSVSKIKAAVVSDNLSAPASGKAHVRFFHFSPNAPAVDIGVTGGPVVFSNRSFNDQASSPALSNFTPLDAGTYNLEVRLAGSDNVVLALPNITLSQGKIYTVFARGFVGGAGAQSLGAQVIVNN